MCVSDYIKAQNKNITKLVSKAIDLHMKSRSLSSKQTNTITLLVAHIYLIITRYYLKTTWHSDKISGKQ
jgi:hypothetical protein